MPAPGKPRRLLRRALLLGLGLAACVYLVNASWLAPSPEGEPWLLAHRGVHQTYPRAGLQRDTCTATRIHDPPHAFVENTVESMREAFALGATMVEFDVHPTVDGHFVVFHDWTLDCRTNGTGVTREQTLAYLQSLDIGHGYTADGGQTFPLRGRFVGMMPTLQEVLDEFPDRRFLINIKSDDPAEGERLADALSSRQAEQLERLVVYGGARPVARVLELVPSLRGFSKQSLKRCLVRYASTGWSSWVPADCRNTVVLVPINLAPWLWGWPNRFLARMRDVGTEVVLVGPYERGDAFTRGIDDPELLDELPIEFDGGLWTNRIEAVAPAL